MARTKIICTLGPASGAETVLRKMIFAGMDVARLNFSHSSHSILSSYVGLIKEINKKYHRHVKILGDLEGHRIRIGALKWHAPVELKKNQAIWLTREEAPGGGSHIPFDYRGPLDKIKNGKYIYIDDGNIALEVIGHGKDSLKTKVIIGGLLKEHKGVNIPDVRLRFRGVSEKDKGHIRFCIRNRIEYVAQSFVRNKQDIIKVRDLLGDNSSGIKVVAKIENREGIKNIDEIIRVSDAIMVARGDMGVSLPIYEIPVIQKRIIRKCNRSGKFVITATQMLESMTENRIPTRAEVTDVANAIIDGTDYVMLSAESAVGKYPVETVDMMDKIIAFTEGYLDGKVSI